MTELTRAVDQVVGAQKDSGKPLGIILAGHNGSGKSTMWRDHLSPRLQIPLVNADRMMMSVLPDVPLARLPDWARSLRDDNIDWMKVAQKGVEAFVAQAMIRQVPFAMETVFSDWHEREDGTVRSKIELIKQMQKAGYFVLLCFVGLSNAALSAGRVITRMAEGGHAVLFDRLAARFPRTQKAISIAREVADAAILVDNSLEPKRAFSICRIQLRSELVYDVRREGRVDPAILEWLDIVSPEVA